MKQPLTKLLRIIPILFFVAQLASGQGYDGQLTIQGIDHTVQQSVASRAAGGITIGMQNDASLMFANPAMLQSLQGIQFSFGGVQQFEISKQVQQYAPLKYYSNFSLVMEGLTGLIPNPSDTLTGRNPGDTVQRAFDSIAPNWSRSKSQGQPIQAMLAVPFTIAEKKLVIGAGAVLYADLNHYYRNNNVLSPSIGSNRPVPISLPASDSTPVVTNWASFQRGREGWLQGYGISLSGALSDKISFGASGMILKGSTDDFEQHVARGKFTFYREWFRLDSVYSNSSSVGTSDFSGQEFTFGGIYRGRYVGFGFSVKPPTTITRKFTTQMQFDSTGTSIKKSINSQDDVHLPWRGTVGLSIAASEQLSLGLEYEIRSFSSAVYTNASGGTSNPWLSASVIHIGAQYSPMDWLAIRIGVRGQSEIFEQTGNPIAGDPVTGSVYSVGCGLKFGGAKFDLSYEYVSMKYQDMWQTNVNLNSNTRHTLLAGISYEISSLW